MVRAIRLTLMVESISQIAGFVAQALCVVLTKNGSKENFGSDSKGVLFSLDFRSHIDVMFLEYYRYVDSVNQELLIVTFRSLSLNFLHQYPLIQLLRYI